MSMFDPAAFLDAATTEVNEKRDLIPTENPDDPNGMYMAVIGDITTADGTIGKGEKIGQPWISMVVPLKLQLPPAVQAKGLPPEFQLTDRVFLDLTPQGSIDNGKGKNRRQRDYREATGLNKAGEAFSWRMLTGKVIKVKVIHEIYNDAPIEKPGTVLPA